MSNSSDNIFFNNGTVALAFGAVAGIFLASLVPNFFDEAPPSSKRAPVTLTLTEAEKAQGCGVFLDKRLNRAIVACPKPEHK